MLSKVMIVGAGTGGLCLAQGLKQFGIDVAVFERDRTPTDRLQGYRLHISSNSSASNGALPSRNFVQGVSWFRSKIEPSGQLSELQLEETFDICNC
jgi:cation diffusion facilitator CzcD-associated flavoprotein CzcO